MTENADLFASVSNPYKHLRIDAFAEGDAVEGFYALREADLGEARNGSRYLRVTLADATGSIQGNMWDAAPETLETIRGARVVKIRAVVESYRERMQLKLENGKIRPAEPDEYDPADFVATTPADIGALRDELARLVASLEDPDYAAVARAFFDDPELLEAFARAPAARENHHAYVGGLLEHTVGLARLAEAFLAAGTTPLDRDLLLTGTLLHDIGKVRELGYAPTVVYTDAGRLIGHLVLGVLMLRERAAALADVPAYKLDLLSHLILSHHGRREYGSPVLPAVPEALALHHIDNLDAKTVAARRLIDEDCSSDPSWTTRSWMLETQLYKGPSDAGGREGGGTA